MLTGMLTGAEYNVLHQDGGSVQNLRQKSITNCIQKRINITSNVQCFVENYSSTITECIVDVELMHKNFEYKSRDL